MFSEKGLFATMKWDPNGVQTGTVSDALKEILRGMATGYGSIVLRIHVRPSIQSKLPSIGDRSQKEHRNRILGGIMNPTKCPRTLPSSQETELLNEIVDAWEACKGGRQVSTREIQDWLVEDMAPAINKARKLLGRKIPS